MPPPLERLVEEFDRNQDQHSRAPDVILLASSVPTAKVSSSVVYRDDRGRDEKRRPREWSSRRGRISVGAHRKLSTA